MLKNKISIEELEKKFVIISKNDLEQIIDNIKIDEQVLVDDKNIIQFICEYIFGNNLISVYISNYMKRFSSDDKNNIKVLNNLCEFINFVLNYVDFDYINLLSNDDVRRTLKYINENNKEQILSNNKSISLLEEILDSFIEIEEIGEDDISSECFYHDSLKIYFKEIGKYKILSSEEQKEIARKMKNSTGDLKIFYRDKLIFSNLRFVASLAKRIHQKYSPKLITLNDLISVGNEAFLLNIDKYNPDYPYTVVTYMGYWINQGMIRYICDNDRTIRIPAYIFEQTKKINRAIVLLTQELGRDPSVDEIAKKIELPREKVLDIVNSSKDLASLDQSISEDNPDSSLVDFIPANDDVEQSVDEKYIKELVRDLIDEKLTEKEAMIIRLRFGINSEQKEYTLEEVGHKLGVTRERIRQIESKALRKLRKPNMAARNSGVILDIKTYKIEDIMPEKESGKTLVEYYFYLYDYYEIVEAINNLSQSSQNIVKNCFGEDYKKVNNNISYIEYIHERIFKYDLPFKLRELRSLKEKNDIDLFEIQLSPIFKVLKRFFNNEKTALVVYLNLGLYKNRYYSERLITKKLKIYNVKEILDNSYNELMKNNDRLIYLINSIINDEFIKEKIMEKIKRL